MWTRSLEDLLTDTPIPDDDWDMQIRESAKRVTEFSASHVSEMRSFPQVYNAEISGFINLHCVEIFHAFQQHTIAQFGFFDGSITA